MTRIYPNYNLSPCVKEAILYLLLSDFGQWTSAIIVRLLGVVGGIIGRSKFALDKAFRLLLAAKVSGSSLVA